MGSSGTDRITAMKMGPNGRLYITGSTDTGEMPYIDGAYNNFNAGLTDIFLAIVDTANSYQPGLLLLPGRREYGHSQRPGSQPRRGGLHGGLHQLHQFPHGRRFA